MWCNKYEKQHSIVVECDGHSLVFDDGSRIYTKSFGDMYEFNTVIEFSPDDFIGEQFDLDNLNIGIGYFTISLTTLDGYKLETDVVSDSCPDISSVFELIIHKKSNGVLEWSDTVDLTQCFGYQ